MSKEIRVIKKEEIDHEAEEERRLEIRYLRHLKRKYPEDDERINREQKNGRK